MNTSATGGYLQPQPAPGQPLPGNYTLNQFIQTCLVGISNFPGSLVRPEWQVNPPKQPDIEVNWLAFGIKSNKSDFNAYVGKDNSNPPIPILLRQEELEVELQVYGPAALENAGFIRDGFQIPQNREALKSGNMDFAYDSTITHTPDLINERWYNRMIFSIFLRRQIQRNYPSILTLVSANGTIYTNTPGDQVITTPWLVED
jgi:hypothetical protein